MNFNKFITKDGEVLLDLTNQTVSAETLAEGETAVDKSGKLITGLMKSGVVGGIKDVAELPTENIDTEAIYRITESKNEPATLYLFYPDLGGVMSFGDILAMELPEEFIVTTTYTEVDELPDPMELAEVNETDLTAKIPVYILKTTGVGYISMYGGGSLRTMTAAEMLFGDPSFDKGYTDNIDSVTEPGFYAVHGASYSNYYYWKHINGNWNKVSPMLDVSELPTENILAETCYRLTPIGEMNLYIMTGGNLMDYNALGEQYGMAITYIPVDALPEIAPEGTSETTIYVVKSTGVPYAAAEGQFVEMGTAMGGLTSYGWIEDPSTITADGVYMFSTPADVEYYTYRNNDWVKFSTGGGSSFDSLIAGVDEETFTFPKGITAIAPYLCYGRSYTTVSIPAGVKSIGEYAFYDCENLTAIEFNGSAAAWGNIEFGNNWISKDLEYAVVCSDGTVIMPNGVAYTPDSEGAAYSVKGLYNKNTTDVEILSTINDVPVVAIADSAFRDNTVITSVNIPENVTSIGQYAFRGCSKLTTANIPRTVTSIGRYAFYNCYKLSNTINIPEGVTTIGADTFHQCYNLPSVTLPSTLTTIDEWAFYSCYNLTNITIPENVTSINTQAFYNCEKLIEVKNLSGLTITAGGNTNGYVGLYAKRVYGADGTSKLVTSGDYLFYADSQNYLMAYTGNDTEITLPSDFNGNSYTLYKYAFYRKNNLVSVTIPGNITEISTGAFYSCSKLANVTMSDNVTTIGEYAFISCSSLANINIPNSVTTIDTMAFRYCSNLTRITIPSSVTEINDSAFEYCYKLIEVQNLSNLNITAGSHVHGYVAYYAQHVYGADGESKLVTSGDYIFYADSENSENYLMAYTGNASDLTLPNDFNGSSYGLSAYAFYNNTTIVNLILPSTLTSIGLNAFGNCDNLVKTQYDNAYYLRSADNLHFALLSYTDRYITSCEVHSDTKIILSRAFYECYELTTVNIPNGVIEIGDEAFYNCPGLTSIDIPSSVNSISSSAFSVCYNIKRVNITDISAWCNTGCALLRQNSNIKLYLNGEELSGEITISEGATKIGNSAFYNCSGITGVTIPEGVTSIGAYAFYNCSNLTSVIIPEGTTIIDSYAFYGCSNLTSITIPSTITKISSDAFTNCYNIKQVYIADIAAWCNIEFSSNSNPLEGSGNASLYLNGELLSGDIVIPEGVTSIGNSAFRGCTGITSITIPEGVTSIGSYAFCNCSRLVKAIIPEGVTDINGSAFRRCYNLVSITIPSTVTTINNYAFYECYKLVEVQNLSSLTITDSSNNGYVGEYAVNIYTADSGESKLITDDNGYIFYVDDENVCLMAYAGTDSELTLPDNINGRDYLLYTYVFSHNTKLISVTIPEGVARIPDYAFDGCTNLTTIYVPNTITAISSTAFNNCPKLTFAEYGNAYYLGNSTNQYNILYKATSTSITTAEINDNTTSVFGNAFHGCTALTSVTIPSSVVNIDNNAFYNCKKITQVHIEDLSAWCNIVFANDSSNPLYVSTNATLYLNGELLSGDIVLSEGATRINNCAFYNCTGVTSIIIPEGVTSIGGYAFYGCSGLTSITIPSTVTSIGTNAFKNCTAISQVHIADVSAWCSIDISNGNNYSSPLVASSGAQLYLNGELLTEAIISEGVTQISHYALQGQANLISVTIPSTVTSIGMSAFTNCSNIERVNIADVDAWCKLSFVNDYSNPLYFSDKAQLYLNGEVLAGDITIPDGITNINTARFKNCANITSVTIPEGVTSIGSIAFKNCTGLISVSIPSTLTEMQNLCFEGCANIEKVNISDLAAWCQMTYGNNPSPLFNSKGQLYLNGELLAGEVVIPNGVTKIVMGAFVNQSSITNIIIPDTVTTIANEAFLSCTGLTSVIIPEGVRSIGQRAFSGCYNLMSIVIPSTMTGISNWAFSGCYKLIEVQNLSTLNIVSGGNYKSYGGIGEYAQNIYDASGSSKLVTSGDYVFYVDTDAISYLVAYTGNNTELTLPNDINGYNYKINSGAFCFTDDLISIVIPKTVTGVLSDAFHQCSSLINVYYTGTQAEWSAISIGGSNTPLTNATITYNYVIPTENLITFTINGTEYQAEDGMTWGEWVESDYNTDGYEAHPNLGTGTEDSKVPAKNQYCITYNSSYVSFGDLIIANASYGTEYQTGAGGSD